MPLSHFELVVFAVSCASDFRTSDRSGPVTGHGSGSGVFEWISSRLQNIWSPVLWLPNLKTRLTVIWRPPKSFLIPNLMQCRGFLKTLTECPCISFCKFQARLKALSLFAFAYSFREGYRNWIVANIVIILLQMILISRNPLMCFTPWQTGTHCVVSAWRSKEWRVTSRESRISLCLLHLPSRFLL